VNLETKGKSNKYLHSFSDRLLMLVVAVAVIVVVVVVAFIHSNL